MVFAYHVDEKEKNSEKRLFVALGAEWHAPLLWAVPAGKLDDQATRSGPRARGNFFGTLVRSRGILCSSGDTRSLATGSTVREALEKRACGQR